ncbi:hypothetical protein [Planctomicrobium sp. SH664]|uniref:hypothetical protein n=1 Tax=Planctomicrobium sp. SH664 TaxID=3448125 RepID=UPI003F5C37FF
MLIPRALSPFWQLAAGVFLLSGCLDPVMFKRAEGEKPAEEAVAEAKAPVENKPANQPQGFVADNHEFVDKKEALAKNPKLVEKERNKVTAGDYLTAVGQTYFAAISHAEMLKLQHSVNLYRAEHDDKPPSFAEFSKMVKECNVQFKGLYRWQVYAYDAETGEMCILEDAELKKKLYAEQGLKAD